MTLVRFDPMRELASMQERLTRLFDDWPVDREDDVMARGAWLPPVDIYQTDEHEVVLRAEVPGLRREDLGVTVERNTLTVSGTRREDASIRKEQYHRVERSYGAFSRSFSLPSAIDSERVAADYKDGVLTVRLPLREEARPKQVEVAVRG